MIYFLVKTIIAGYVLGVDAERGLVDLSYFGVAYGVLASLFVTLNAIFTTRTLPLVNHNLWKLGNLLLFDRNNFVALVIQNYVL